VFFFLFLTIPVSLCLDAAACLPERFFEEGKKLKMLQAKQASKPKPAKNQTTERNIIMHFAFGLPSNDWKLLLLVMGSDGRPRESFFCHHQAADAPRLFAARQRL